MGWIGLTQPSFSAERVRDCLVHLSVKQKFCWTTEYNDIFCYDRRTLPFDFAVRKNGLLYLVEYDDDNIHT